MCHLSIWIHKIHLNPPKTFTLNTIESTKIQLNQTECSWNTSRPNSLAQECGKICESLMKPMEVFWQRRPDWNWLIFCRSSLAYTWVTFGTRRTWDSWMFTKSRTFCPFTTRLRSYSKIKSTWSSALPTRLSKIWCNSSRTAMILFMLLVWEEATFLFIGKFSVYFL